MGAGLDPCVALQCAVDLQPGEERSLTFTLGQGENAFQARDLAAKYHHPGPNEDGTTTEEAEYQGTLGMWEWLLSAVQVETPDAGMNLLLNRWSLYQSISCRLWAAVQRSTRAAAHTVSATSYRMSWPCSLPAPYSPRTDITVR